MSRNKKPLKGVTMRGLGLNPHMPFNVLSKITSCYSLPYGGYSLPKGKFTYLIDFAKLNCQRTPQTGFKHQLHYNHQSRTVKGKGSEFKNFSFLFFYAKETFSIDKKDVFPYIQS